jgi:hypothetical protein
LKVTVFDFFFFFFLNSFFVFFFFFFFFQKQSSSSSLSKQKPKLEKEKSSSKHRVANQSSAAATPRPVKPAPPAPMNQKFNTMSNNMVKEFLQLRAQNKPDAVPFAATKPALPSQPSPARRSMPPSKESLQAAAQAVALAKLQLGDYAASSIPPPLPPSASFSFPKPPPPIVAPTTPLPPPPPPMSVSVEFEQQVVAVPMVDDRLMAKKVAMLEIEVENLQKRLELKEQYIVSMKRVHERTEKQLQEKLDEALRAITILDAVGQFNAH